MIKQNKFEQGFSLIQMAIALIVVGVLIGVFFSAWDLYKIREARRVTEENVRIAINELQSFKRLNGFLPCPAPLGAPRNDNTYGAPTNCADTSVAPGTAPTPGSGGMNGIGIKRSLNTALADRRVRYGALPFRLLNMEEKQSYDGYGSRLVYAVTESQTIKATADNRNGGIGLLTPANVTAITPANSAIFVLYSVGRDRSGGYAISGLVPIPCTPGRVDTLNCDPGINAVYRTAVKSEANNANHFDDTINYFTELPDMHWVRAPADTNNIVDTSPQAIGIGTATPRVKLDIQSGSSNPALAELPRGTLRASGRVIADRLCPSASANSTATIDSNCFEVRNLTGDNSGTDAGTPATAGEGMKCPADQYMIGIAEGKPICGPAAVQCSGTNTVLRGFNSSGNPICDYQPCPATVINDCNQNKTLPAAERGTNTSITFGSTGIKTKNYSCTATSTDVVWNFINETGACTCDAGPLPDENPLCKTIFGNGTYYTGRCTVKKERRCPAGNVVVVSNDCNAACPSTCAPPSVRTERRNQAVCPQYKTGTGSYDEYSFKAATCSMTKDRTVSDCTCQTQSDYSQRLGNCPAGYTGEGIYQRKKFNADICDFTDDGPVDNRCSCNATETQAIFENPTCTSSQIVATQTEYKQIRDGPNCTWGSKTLVREGECKEREYFWRISYTTTTSDRPIGPAVGDRCTYEQFTAGATTTCSQVSGSRYIVNQCSCRSQ